MDLITMLKNLFYPLIAPLIDHGKYEETSNWYNEPSIEELAPELKDEEVVQKIEQDREILIPQFTWPTSDRPIRITSKFGWRTLPNGRGGYYRNFHIGVDFAGERDIHAPEDCVVKKVLGVDKEYPVRFHYKKNKTTGKWEWINVAPKGRAWTPYVKVVGVHTGAWYSFKHVKAGAGIKPGKKLKCGDVLGKSGNLGYSMGPHLHAEVWPDAGKKVWTKKYGWTRWPKPVDISKWLNKRVSLLEKQKV